jgi:citrate lyase alpha subunit
VSGALSVYSLELLVFLDGRKCIFTVICQTVSSTVPSTHVDEVTTLCGPGELIDVVVTERGIAVNPRRRQVNRADFNV